MGIAPASLKVSNIWQNRLENIYVTDTYNNLIQKFDRSENFILIRGRAGKYQIYIE